MDPLHHIAIPVSDMAKAFDWYEDRFVEQRYRRFGAARMTKNAPNTTSDVTVFYDGACPLCEREIAFYRKRKNADSIDWVDVSKCATVDVVPGLSKADALARFHVIGADGKLVSGGSAFREVWAVLPAFRIWGWLFRFRAFSWLLNRAYDAFLKFRPRLQAVLRRHAAKGKTG